MYCSTALATVSIVFQASRDVFSLIAHEQYSQVWREVFVSLDILGCVHVFSNTVCQDVTDTTPSIILYPSKTLAFPLSCLTLCEIRLSNQSLHAWWYEGPISTSCLFFVRSICYVRNSYFTLGCVFKMSLSFEVQVLTAFLVFPTSLPSMYSMRTSEFSNFFVGRVSHVRSSCVLGIDHASEVQTSASSSFKVSRVNW